MNEQRKWIIVLAMIAVFVGTAALLPALVRAGNLEPSAPPRSTMHTLDEIYYKLNRLVPNGLVPVTKTGQTNKCVDGDDGDSQKGVTWPVPRFTDHEDGTVTDNLTGLMWTKDANIYGSKPWADALSDCATCTTGGHSDWRLPNVRELHSLIDYGQKYPALPAGHPFTSVQLSESSWYWSSTRLAYCANRAWLVRLYVGDVTYDELDDHYCVWCVRGGYGQ